MGEVYRARDTLLGREVALKIVPPAFTGDEDRMARFQREAQVLASLNHPNIGAIYGIERSGTVTALVLELIEGPTLQERIQSGPLPPDEALDIARQIAEAVEAAHARGIVHRDLKPANVKLTPEGRVKVLDFGLAKALDTAPASASGTSPSPLSSPTLTSPVITGALTGANVILGTAAYMSPEQARGKPVDSRADVWAFGVVLFEMLTGKSLFAGETVSDTLASVLQREPDWDLLPRAVPPSIRRLLGRCLTKDLRQRLQAIGEARIAIEKFQADPQTATQEETASSRSGPLRTLLAAAAGALVVALAWLLLDGRTGADIPAPLTRFSIETDGSGLRDIGVSPDGSAFFIRTAERTLVRRRDELEGTQVGDRRTITGAFSPDGRWIALYSLDDEIIGSGRLQKALLERGTMVTLREMKQGGTPFDWSGDAILVAQYEALLRVPADGGAPDTLWSRSGAEAPWFQASSRLDDQRILGTLWSPREESAKEIGVVDVASGTVSALGVPGHTPTLVSSGHLLFLRDRTLMGVAFDARSLEIRGPASPLIPDVDAYACSPDGTLIYHLRSRSDDKQRVIAADLTGTVEPTQVELSAWFVRAAPDGRRIVTEGTDGLLVHDLSTRSVTPVQTGKIEVSDFLWAPDGIALAYTGFSAERDTCAIYLQAPDEPAPSVLLRDDPDIGIFPTGWSPDGAHLIYSRYAGDDSDLWLLPLDGSDPRPLLATESSEDLARFSPDGAWIAYESNESGRQEVYVSPLRLPEGTLGAKWKISDEGGKDPIWSPRGGELYFEDFQDRLIAVSVTTRGASSLTVGEKRVLFDLTAVGRGVLSEPDLSYDVVPSGDRVLFIETPDAGENRVHVVLNWLQEVEAVAP
jgi:serine/threonine-protein kinase